VREKEGRGEGAEKTQEGEGKRMGHVNEKKAY